jgi:hypothetical protein
MEGLEGGMTGLGSWGGLVFGGNPGPIPGKGNLGGRIMGNCPSGPGTGRPQPSNPKERSERGLQGIQFTDLRVREAEWVAHKRRNLPLEAEPQMAILVALVAKLTDQEADKAAKQVSDSRAFSC